MSYFSKLNFNNLVTFVVKEEFIIENGIEYHTILYDNGTVVYHLNGQKHRLAGPAAIFSDERLPQWFYQGKIIDVSSQEEFEQWLTLRVFA